MKNKNLLSLCLFIINIPFISLFFNSEKTIDGFEKMLQVNYLSHFLMVAKLLPVMRKSGPDCRILFMSSDAHRACSFDVETMNYEGNASKFGRLDYYGRSKLYQVNNMSLQHTLHYFHIYETTL
jgi:NAD(P)-dependent dehydrogenase (short-subunit alcohol dehydrogenase family)